MIINYNLTMFHKCVLVIFFTFCSHLNNRSAVEVCNISIPHNVHINVNRADLCLSFDSW